MSLSVAMINLFYTFTISRDNSLSGHSMLRAERQTPPGLKLILGGVKNDFTYYIKSGKSVFRRNRARFEVFGDVFIFI